MKSNMQDLIEAVSELSSEELKSLNSVIVSRLRSISETKNIIAKSRIVVGGKYKVNHPKAFGKVFIVEKINPKKVVCIEQSNFSRWKIPPTLLEKI